MSLLPRNFLINDAYLTELGDPIKPAVYVEPPKPPADDWTCAVASDNPPKPKATLADAARAVSTVLAKRKPKPWINPEEIEPANPKPVPKSARPFQVGDLVRILDDSRIHDYKGGWFPASMREQIGRTYTVVGQHRSGALHVEGTRFVFDPRGLELVEAAK